MVNGTIKTVTDKGFGFITQDGEAKDVFFHAKDLVGTAFDDLRVGDKVQFEVTEGEKGPRASAVERVA